mmetsp:Transcript_31111/g.68762  ORF Transcript_31111/g.68762 Transcript_31111/m.68762 type:complete len:252 (+) Transcript_31111:47-802(+)
MVMLPCPMEIDEKTFRTKVRVNRAPNDSDRMRFGFKYTGAGQGKLRRGTTETVTDILAQKTFQAWDLEQRKLRRECAKWQAEVEELRLRRDELEAILRRSEQLHIEQDVPTDGSFRVHDLVDKVLGDPKPLLSLMERKAATGQLDHSQQLKAALYGQLQGRKHLISLLACVELDVTHRFQYAQQDVLIARQEKEAMSLELAQRGKQLEACQEQLKAAKEEAFRLNWAAGVAAGRKGKSLSELDSMAKDLDS